LVLEESKAERVLVVLSDRPMSFFTSYGWHRIVEIATHW